MNGGTTRAAAHTAIAILAGLLLNTASAKAADLGGDCCADLEERVAELEATTARKGNRRMSLTVSGQVTRSILYWNDGANSGTYAGLDNHNQSTRFVFSGSAKISPTVSAGFEFMTEWAVGARTSSVNQDSPDGGLGTVASPFTNADGGLAVRTANWWLEEKSIGKIAVGRVNVGGPVGTIDLGGISTVAHWSPQLVGAGFYLNGGKGPFVLNSVVGPTYGGDRVEGIRFDSANFGGFVLGAVWGEDDVWSASLRYAGEFGGIRVAAGIGYEAQDPSPKQAIQLDNGARAMDNEWSASLALMHVASGLFVQGHYAESEFLNGADAKFWMVQGGITKNWFGLGNTSLYGEYGEATDFIKIGSVTAPFSLANTVMSSDVNFYGIGAVQQIDAAAMELYLGWRRFEVDITGAGAAGGSSEIDLVHGGARIRF